MEIDTGQFQAITDALVRLTPAAQAIAALGGQVAGLAAQAAEAEAAVRHSGPRHARPRGGRPGWLRVVDGGTR